MSAPPRSSRWRFPAFGLGRDAARPRPERARLRVRCRGPRLPAYHAAGITGGRWSLAPSGSSLLGCPRGLGATRDREPLTLVPTPELPWLLRLGNFTVAGRLCGWFTDWPWGYRCWLRPPALMTAPALVSKTRPIATATWPTLASWGRQRASRRVGRAGLPGGADLREGLLLERAVGGLLDSP